MGEKNRTHRTTHTHTGFLGFKSTVSSAVVCSLVCRGFSHDSAVFLQNCRRTGSMIIIIRSIIRCYCFGCNSVSRAAAAAAAVPVAVSSVGASLTSVLCVCVFSFHFVESVCFAILSLPLLNPRIPGDLI